MMPPPFKEIAVTRIKSRTPEWKLHRNLGMAKRSISEKLNPYQFPSIVEVWMLVDLGGQLGWKQIWQGPSNTEYADLPWSSDKKWRG